MSEREDLEAKVKSLEEELAGVRGKLDARDRDQARALESLLLKIGSLEDTVNSLEKELERLNVEQSVEADRASELSDEARRAQAHVEELRTKLAEKKK